ncbi:unnamed protein product [Blepharisma stoltei]|uniref:FYVE-type domain-containing protein n=1 Tax=Blepharisma stoltei TaxID=1481888 RepID=A0AAU9J5Y2_9CILI|nr:unnamed protein product [Blepharisma stoltei]
MDEDNKSDTSSNNSSFVDPNKSIYDVYIDIAPNEQQWKKDKVCHICKKKFGSKISLINEKKFRCKFCWRGTCGDCSKTRARHPDFDKPQRICNSCFQKSKENKISETYTYELNRARSDNDELQIQLESAKRENEMLIKEKEQLEEKLEQVQNDANYRVEEQQHQADTLKVKKEKIAKKYGKMRNKIQAAEEDRDGQYGSINVLKYEAESLKDALERDKAELEEARNIIAEKQAEKERLLRKLEEEEAPPVRENKTRKRGEKEEKLIDEIEAALNQIKEIKGENKSLTQELTELDTEISTIEEKTQKVQNDLDQGLTPQEPGVRSVRQSMVAEEEKKIKELKETVQEQQQKIERLKAEIQSSKTLNDREMSSADY